MEFEKIVAIDWSGAENSGRKIQVAEYDPRKNLVTLVRSLRRKTGRDSAFGTNTSITLPVRDWFSSESISHLPIRTVTRERTSLVTVKLPLTLHPYGLRSMRYVAMRGISTEDRSTSHARHCSLTISSIKHMRGASTENGSGKPTRHVDWRNLTKSPACSNALERQSGWDQLPGFACSTRSTQKMLLTFGRSAVTPQPAARP